MLPLGLSCLMRKAVFDTVNFRNIFVRVLISPIFAYAKFPENKPLEKRPKHSVVNCYTGFPHNRENGKSPGIRYWSFTAMKSPGISTFGDLSRELSGKICSLAHPQRHSYAWMLNLVYQLFFRKKTAQL